MTHCLVTGGAGYIGSLLVSVLLQRGYQVTVIDNLAFGGETLLAHWYHPNFQFIKGDITEANALNAIFNPESGGGDNVFPFPKFSRPPSAVVHLAAIVGFPACQAVGAEAAWHCNVMGTRHLFEAANANGADKFIFASTYSNYGLAEDNKPVTEESPLHPQSLYAETKIAAEQYLLQRASTDGCVPLIFRFATLFGVSPRTRFDLIINQFVAEALTSRQLTIYQRGYSRSFVHVRDVVEGIWLGLEVPIPQIRDQVYNLGADSGNFTKDDIVTLIKKHIPETQINYKNLEFSGDMRDITVSFAKIRRKLNFQPQIDVEQGIVEIINAIKQGLVKNPLSDKYRNAGFIIQ